MSQVKARPGRSLPDAIHHGRPLMGRQTDTGSTLQGRNHLQGHVPLSLTSFLLFSFSPCILGGTSMAQSKNTKQKVRGTEHPNKPHERSGALDRSPAPLNSTALMLSWMLWKLELIAQMKGFVVNDAAIKMWDEEEGKALVHTASSPPRNACHSCHYPGLYGDNLKPELNKGSLSLTWNKCWLRARTQSDKSCTMGAHSLVKSNWDLSTWLRISS